MRVRSVRAAVSEAVGGGVSNWKAERSRTPQACACRTTAARSTRRISGIVDASRRECSSRGPESKREAGTRSTRAAGPLIGGVTTDRFGDEAVQSAVRDRAVVAAAARCRSRGRPHRR